MSLAPVVLWLVACPTGLRTYHIARGGREVAPAAALSSDRLRPTVPARRR